MDSLLDDQNICTIGSEQDSDLPTESKPHTITQPNPISDTTSRNEILRTLAQNNGSMSLPDNVTGHDLISNYTEIQVWCGHGHHWKTIVGNLREWCAICRVLIPMRKYDQKIISMQTEYLIGQTKFEFKCSVGHRFIANERSSRHGCKSCYLLSIARKKHAVDAALTLDIKCVYAHEESKLRFHCNKLRHNPFCQNENCIDILKGKIISNRDFAPDCRNFVSCNQDFYATPRQIKYEPSIYSCKYNHQWDKNSEVIACIRLFEIIFNMRFDDDSHQEGILFTGYNIELKLAFTHGGDKIPNRCVTKAAKWCDDNKIRFVFINPENIRKTSQLGNAIVKQLAYLDVINDSTPEAVLLRARTKMRCMNANHKLFMDRCVYD